jgi:hypothetical protein
MPVETDFPQHVPVFQDDYVLLKLVPKGTGKKRLIQSTLSAQCSLDRNMKVGEFNA